MQSDNSPYAPPKSATDPGREQAPLVSVVPARRWLRLSNFAIDGFISLALVVLVAFLSRVVLLLLWGPAGLGYVTGIPIPLVWLTVYAGYYLVLEASMGRTVGKWATGTRVVDERGLPASPLQVLGRTVLRLVPLEALTFLGPQPRGLHDRLSRTYVVSSA